MTSALIVLAVTYVVLCAALYLLQDYVMFPGIMRPRARDFVVPENVSIERIRTPEGIEYRIAIGVPKKATRGVLVFFVGNGEDLSSGVRWAAEFADYGFETLVTEYPGYGDSGGTAGFASIMAAAETSGARAEARAKELGLPLYLAGHSLGSFSAVHLASLGYGEKMLLAAPPTSIAAVGQRRFWFLPVGLLLRHPFENLSKAAGIDLPTLIIHGKSDTVVPFDMGQRLSATFPDAKLVAAEHAGHNSLHLYHGGPFTQAIEQHFFPH